MKTTKTLLALITCAVTSLFVIACSDDDEVKTDTYNFTNSVDYSIQPEAIDLGLSVKWASCNLGATTPEGDGGFFAWGETVTKELTKYNWSGYKYANLKSDTTMTKYVIVDEAEIHLDAVDDAATVNLGGKWRMPTYAECYELTTKCTHEWTMQNGATGYKFTAANGNSIFIPAAGFLTDAGELSNHWSQGANAAKGCYWSSTLHSENEQMAFDLFFYYPDYVNGDYDQWYRYAAQPIRPVYAE